MTFRPEGQAALEPIAPSSQEAQAPLRGQQPTRSSVSLFSQEQRDREETGGPIQAIEG